MGTHVLALPISVVVVRTFQIIFAVMILGMSAWGIYWIAFGSWGIALFTSLATIIIAIYAITTQNISSWRGAYNYWAILVLDIFMIIFWLASMGALAATRGTFTVPTKIDECVNNGHGGVCDKKRDLLKRVVYVATNGYLDMMSGSAGLSAVEMILFCVTLTIFGIHLTRFRASRTVNIQETGYKLEQRAGVMYAPVAQQMNPDPRYMQSVPQQQQQPVPTYQQYPQSPMPAQQQYYNYQPNAHGY